MVNEIEIIELSKTLQKFNEIPDEYKIQFHIKYDKECDEVDIHKPNFIGITKLDEVKVSKYWIVLRNNKVSLTLWKNLNTTHTTIF